MCDTVDVGTQLTGMCQTESPQAQVGSRVGDAAKAVLNGVDGLVQEHVPKVKLLTAKATQIDSKIIFYLCHSSFCKWMI